jgi:hypothetical protein
MVLGGTTPPAGGLPALRRGSSLCVSTTTLNHLATVVDPAAAAGAIAADLWDQLGRRRALIVSTKLRRLAELEPAWRTVRGGPGACSNERPVFTITDLLADAAD